MYSYDCQSNWGVNNFKIHVFLSFLQEYNLAYIYIYMYIAFFIHDKNMTGTIFWAE